MHNRRLFYDDGRGVDEALNETDEYGNGIRVTTTYYLQLFNASLEASAQRSIQAKADDPAMLLFNFNYALKQSDHSVASLKRLPTSSELKAFGLPDTGKLTIFAQAQNQLLLRLTNYADKFDLGENPTTPYIKVDQLALSLYTLANPQSQSVPLITISETSLTGN